MQKSSKSPIRLSDSNINRIALLLNKELKPINMIQLCQMCYSLKSYDSNNDSILSLTQALTTKLVTLNTQVSAHIYIHTH